MMLQSLEFEQDQETSHNMKSQNSVHTTVRHQHFGNSEMQKKANATYSQFADHHAGSPAPNNRPIAPESL